LHARAHERGHPAAALRFAEQAATDRQHAATVRALLINDPPVAGAIDAGTSDSLQE
jgi:hypothetical protein